MKKHFFVAAIVSLQLQYVTAQTWTAKQNGLIANRGIIDIAAPDAFNAYGMAYDASNFGNHLREITFTHDGGYSWKAQAIKELEGFRITGLGTSTGTTVHVIAWNPATINGPARGGKVVCSINGGNNWSPEAVNTFTNTASFPDDISFINAADGVMFGDPVAGSFEIYTTGNGGQTWTKVPASKIPAQVVTATQTEIGSAFVMEKFGNTFVTATVIYNNNDGSAAYGRLLQSDDKGKTWYVKNPRLPIKAWDLTMKFRDKNVGLLKNGGKLYRTANGGTTWTLVSFKGSYFPYDLDDIPGKAGWWISTGGEAGMVGNTSPLGSSISYDDGNNWKKIDTAVSHTCVEMIAFNHGYSGGVSTDKKGSNGIYVYFSAKSTKSTVEETEAIVDNATTPLELNVFPNPSSESFSVSLNSPNERFALIRLINTQGVVVSSQRIVPVGTISFGSELAAGIYTAEIIIGSNKNTFQIVKQ